jgi:hypothetical protein
VRVTGEVGAPGLVGPGQEHALQGEDLAGHGGQLPLAEQAQRGRDLVVAATAGVQLRPCLSGQFGDTPLDRGVHVLVGREEGEGPLGELDADTVERGEHDGALVGGEDPGAHEPADVGPRARHVVGRQAAVEAQALGEGQQLRRRAAFEPPVPQRGHVLPGPCTADHRSVDRPHRRTNPAESSWRKLSSAS